MTNRLPIIIAHCEGCDVVAFDYGEAEHNGMKYRLASPYTDKRPKHWFNHDTPITIVSSEHKDV